MMRHAWLLLCWTVLFSPLRTIDGDTFEGTAEVWHRLSVRETVRVLGVDTPERKDPGWLAAKEFTDAWLQKGPVTVATCRRDSFGRVLGFVSRDGVRLDMLLIDKGMGKAR